MSVAMLVGIAAAAAIVLLAVRFAGAWMKYHGDRVITCPENEQPAGVRLDAVHAAAAIAGSPDLRLSACSRWPEHKDCGQECLRQIEAAPEDCLVRTIYARWYEGKSCAICRRPIRSISAETRPAVLRNDGISVEWASIAPESLPETLASGKPVCFGCHQATSFAREHPDLVIKRSRPA